MKGRLWLTVLHCKFKSVSIIPTKQLNKKLTFRLLYCNLHQNSSDEGYGSQNINFLFYCLVGIMDTDFAMDIRNNYIYTVNSSSV